MAYEGKRKRVHLCILDELDPYGPACASSRPKREPSASSFPSGPPPLTHPNTSEETEDPDQDHSSSSDPAFPSSHNPSKPPPIGHRLLPIISLDSEIGQADKHALKNVTRVERFIQDVVRKSVEEELVFPNFHTVVLGDG